MEIVCVEPPGLAALTGAFGPERDDALLGVVGDLLEEAGSPPGWVAAYRRFVSLGRWPLYHKGRWHWRHGCSCRVDQNGPNDVCRGGDSVGPEIQLSGPGGYCRSRPHYLGHRWSRSLSKLDNTNLFGGVGIWHEYGDAWEAVKDAVTALKLLAGREKS